MGASDLFSSLKNLLSDGGDKTSAGEKLFYSPWDKRAVKALVVTAASFLDKYPEGTVICLGHSASYFGHAAKLLGERQDKNINLIHVPFSGRYLKFEPGFTDKEKGASRIYSINEWEREKYEKNREYYQSELWRLGVTPQLIVSRFEKTQQRTAIVDYVEKGGGMLSFTHFVDQWALASGVSERKFLNAVELISLSDEKGFNDRWGAVVLDTGFEATAKNIRILPSLAKVINGTVNTSGNDRMVPECFRGESLEKSAQRFHADKRLIEGILKSIEIVVDETYPHKPSAALRQQQGPSVLVSLG